MRSFWALMLLSALSLSAVPSPSWEFAGWHGGGCFPNVEIDHRVKGRVYLTSDVAGIMRSDDLGENWRIINEGLGNLNIAALSLTSNVNTLYAASATGLYISRNAGTTWQETQNPENQIKFQKIVSYRPIAVSPQDPLRVCVATTLGKVLCSLDAGQSWQVLKQFPAEVLTNIVFNKFGAKLFVGGSAGLRIYDFTTGLWSALYADLYDLTDLQILGYSHHKIYVAANGELWLSSNEGKSWVKAKGTHYGKIYRFAMVSQMVPKIFAAANNNWSGKVIMTSDNGATWNDVVATITPDLTANPTNIWSDKNSKVISIKINPWDTKMMFRTNGWGVFRTRDSGLTWLEKIRGAPNTVGSDIKFIGNELFVATMDNGLLKSGDKGLTYQTVFPFNTYDPATAGHVWRVISPAANKIVATFSPWDQKVNQVIVSNDGGQTFTIVRSGLPVTRPAVNTMWAEGYPKAIAFDPSNPNRIYLGIDGDDGGGLFISNDGGLNWTRSIGQPGSLRIYNGLAVDPTNTQRIFWGASGVGGGVWISEDCGMTWRLAFNAMSWVFDLAVTPNGTIYVAGDAGGPTVYSSTDNGITWIKNINFGPKGSAEALVVDPMNQNRIAVSAVLWSAGASGKIYLSSDAGLTWIEMTANLPSGAGAAAMTFSPDGKELYISRYAGSVYRLKLQ